MTIQECYARMGADYDGVIQRFGKEERIRRFLEMFLRDESYGLLVRSLDGGDAGEAFRAAHSLKGVSVNLGLTALYESSSALADALRGGSITEEAGPLFEQLGRDYQAAVDCIEKFGGTKA